MIISVLISVVVLGYCEAQFGGFTATQSCVGSSCNQNNFSRKRRQILEEILTEVEAEDLAREVAKREAVAEPQGFGSVSFSATQNCAGGSNCNQNNFGRKKREIAEMIESLTKDVLETGAKEVKKVEPQMKQMKAESNSGLGSFSTQSCVGRRCKTEESGRKKREVIAALLREILEVEAVEEALEREKREAEAEAQQINIQICGRSVCDQNNNGGGGGGISSSPQSSSGDCSYRCTAGGGCEVDYVGPSRGSGVSSTKGSCFPRSFGGGCSGTPRQCRNCNQEISCG